VRVFIDESGSFSWRQPGWSIVAAIGICEIDGTFESIVERLRVFERSLPKERRSPSGEIKGAVLTDQELATFVWDVLPRRREFAHVSLVGFDSRKTPRDLVARFREALARGGAKERQRYASRKNQRMVQAVDEAVAWMRRRSDEDVGWLLATQVAIADSFTHSVVALLGDEHDDGCELAELSYVLDRSSRIRGERQEYLWRQILNSALCSRSEHDPFPRIRQWPANHAFVAKYRCDQGFDFRELWRGIKFGDSQQTPGLRIADLVAQVAVRHFARDKAVSAWKRLRPIVMGPDGRHLHAVAPALRPTS
jgi:hypothetical protein